MKTITLFLFFLLSFSLLKAQEKATFTDPRDGAVYNTVTLAGQTWMAENLNFPVPGSWCYEDEDDNCVNYGRLYDWPAAKTACPAGWHLPSDAEWKKLISHFPVDRAGGQLKSMEYWDRPNTSAADSIGFAALPAGSRDVDTTYSDLGQVAHFWTATETTLRYAWKYVLSYENALVGRFDDRRALGFSVRCVKD